jgi:hypothetical protein
MAPRGRLLRAAAVLAPAALLAGCIDRPPDPTPGYQVFRGAFTTGVTPWAFSGSKLDALSVDSYATFDGQSTVRIDVPAASSTPGFSGGPFLVTDPVDLSRYTALTFWTRAAAPATLDKVGFGLDFTESWPFMTAVFGLPLTTQWTAHRVPIADPARMPPQRGLFWYGASSPTPYSFWFADVRFMDVPAADLDLQPSLALTTLTTAVGRKVALPCAVSYADVDGTRRWLDSTDAGSGPSPAFLTYDSDDWAVASVDGTGTLIAVSPGQAVITPHLAGVPFPEGASSLAVTVLASLPTAPTAGPPDPGYATSDVIPLFTGKYGNRTGANFYASWSNQKPDYTVYPGSAFSQPAIGGNQVLKYTALHYAGVDFTSSKVDASQMAYLHVDVWTPDATRFGLKLVSIPASGTATEATVAFSGRSRPPILPSTWISLDIPLSAFAGVPLDSLGQIVWLDNAAIGATSAGGGDEAGTFFVDNVYFHK